MVTEEEEVNTITSPNGDKSDEVDEPKLDSETALAKIKVLIANHYEMKGRGDYNDYYGKEEELLEDIEDVLSKAEIDMRKVIVEKFELDKLGNKTRLSVTRKSKGIGGGFLWGK